MRNTLDGCHRLIRSPTTIVQEGSGNPPRDSGSWKEVNSGNGERSQIEYSGYMAYVRQFNPSTKIMKTDLYGQPDAARPYYGT